MICSWSPVDAECAEGRRSELLTMLEQAVTGYRCGFFKPETMNFCIREHEGGNQGLGSRTPVPPGACLLQWRQSAVLCRTCYAPLSGWSPD